MKKGDRVLCINDVYIEHGLRQNHKCHIKGHYYTVDIFNGIINDIYVYIIAETNTTWFGVYGFKFEDFTKNFITVKDLRKQKLEKINENK